MNDFTVIADVKLSKTRENYLFYLNDVSFIKSTDRLLFFSVYITILS